MKVDRNDLKRIFSGINSKAMQSRKFVILFFSIALLISILYLCFAWNRYEKIASSEAIMLAQSLEAMLNPEKVSQLSGSPEDLKKPEYHLIKSRLQQLVETSNPISFAYLMGEQDGKLVFWIDSEDPASPNYSPPGQVYTEASDIHFKPFRSGQTILTNPTTDRWGTWISVFVPIKDTRHNQVFAVLGIDYSAAVWNINVWKHMIPDLTIVACLMILFYALLISQKQRFNLKKLSQKLAYDEALYHCVFDQVPVGIAVGSNEDHVIKPEYEHFNMNPAFEKILGRTSHELANMKWTEITHPEDLQADLEKFQQFTAGEIQGYSLEKRYIRPDGSSVWTNMIISPFVNTLSGSNNHICLIEDISKRKEAEALLTESERSKSVLLSNLPGMAYRCSYDGDWAMEFISAGCVALTGYHSEVLLHNKDLSFYDLISPENLGSLFQERKQCLAGKQPFKCEYEIIAASGEHKWVLEMGQGIYNNQGSIEAIEGIVFDISDRKRTEDQLKYYNEHDVWTGLYNRRYLQSFLSVVLGDENPGNKALVGINLSSIHALSLTYGFQYSRELIRKVADELNKYHSDYCKLFNTHENRFIFYLGAYKDKNELHQFCGNVVSILESLLSIERIGGAIAVIEIDEFNQHDTEQLLKNLLIASERAMSSHDKDFVICFLDREIEAQIIRENHITQELAQIIAGEDTTRLYLQYQPILDLEFDRICGFEALARLNSNQYGRISPLEFIPLAEKTKHIVSLGYEIIVQALAFLKRLNEKGYHGVGVSINISAIQLVRSDFPEQLFDIIKKMQVDPADIGLEITESVFASSYEDINRILGKLKESGFKIALDDFGTGYSSLAHERELNITCLKIDKSFIDNLLSIQDGQAITSDIISMAHKLGHCVIAEGVEHEKQLQYLKQNGCDKVQGYLIERPLNEEAAIELIEKQTPRHQH